MNKQKLYESIMSEIAKVVKAAINEKTLTMDIHQNDAMTKEYIKFFLEHTLTEEGVVHFVWKEYNGAHKELEIRGEVHDRGSRTSFKNSYKIKIMNERHYEKILVMIEDSMAQVLNVNNRNLNFKRYDYVPQYNSAGDPIYIVRQKKDY